jgi:putative acetyltransferase
MFTIRPADLSEPQTVALLALHLMGMQANSPPEAVFALDLSGMRASDLDVWTAWDGDKIAGLAALRTLSPDHGEIKSMRTHPYHLRRGVAALLLTHIVAEARARGMTRLSLETGSGPAFDPALALYRRQGFGDGPAFGDYRQSDFNQFLHLDL